MERLLLPQSLYCLFNFDKMEIEMLEKTHIIEPERMGLWTAAAFVLALLALVLSFVNLYRTAEMMAITQAEILILNHKIEGAGKASATPGAVQKEVK